MRERIKNFEQLEYLAASRPKQSVALAAANSEEALLAAEYARKKGIIDVELVGDQKTIQDVFSKKWNQPSELRTYRCPEPKRSGRKRQVALVREGKAQLLMKRAGGDK